MKAIITFAQFELAKMTLQHCCSAAPASVKQIFDKLDIIVNNDDKPVAPSLTDFQVIWLIYTVLTCNEEQFFNPEALMVNFQHLLSTIRPQLSEINYASNYLKFVSELVNLKILFMSDYSKSLFTFNRADNAVVPYKPILNSFETAQHNFASPVVGIYDDYDNLDLSSTMLSGYPNSDLFPIPSPPIDPIELLPTLKNAPLADRVVVAAPVAEYVAQYTSTKKRKRIVGPTTAAALYPEYNKIEKRALIEDLHKLRDEHTKLKNEYTSVIAEYRSTPSASLSAEEHSRISRLTSELANSKQELASSMASIKKLKKENQDLLNQIVVFKNNLTLEQQLQIDANKASQTSLRLLTAENAKLKEKLESLQTLLRQKSNFSETEAQALLELTKVKQELKMSELRQIKESKQFEDDRTKLNIEIDNYKLLIESNSVRNSNENDKTNAEKLKLEFQEIVDSLTNQHKDDVLLKTQQAEKILLLSQTELECKAVMTSLESQIRAYEIKFKDLQTQLSQSHQGYQEHQVNTANIIKEYDLKLQLLQVRLESSQREDQLLTKQLQDANTLNNTLAQRHIPEFHSFQSSHSHVHESIHKAQVEIETIKKNHAKETEHLNSLLAASESRHAMQTTEYNNQQIDITNNSAEIAELTVEYRKVFSQLQRAMQLLKHFRQLLLERDAFIIALQLEANKPAANRYSKLPEHEVVEAVYPEIHNIRTQNNLLKIELKRILERSAKASQELQQPANLDDMLPAENKNSAQQTEEIVVDATANINSDPEQEILKIVQKNPQDEKALEVIHFSPSRSTISSPTFFKADAPIPVSSPVVRLNQTNKKRRRSSRRS